ncbi:MAG: ATP-dependent DNA helicase RecG [Oscillospiraceae bacterium]|nr:ATP-dependent DNA helicase RecG [Oscillospiraceae bacterium]
MPKLDTDIRYLAGVGEARAKTLRKLGIETVQDLVSYFPRSYEDRKLSPSISTLPLNENAAVVAMVASTPTLSRIRKGLSLVKFRVVDESGSMDITFFNRPYAKEQFQRGESYVFYGRVEGSLLRRQMNNPIVEKEGVGQLTGGIVPVYPLTAGVTQTLLVKLMRQGLAIAAEQLPEELPDDIRQKHSLCYVNYAYENIHFPPSPEALAIARRRLVFEELFFLTAGLRLWRSERARIAVTPCKGIDLAPFYDALPFTLTGAQRRAIEDGVRDMCAGTPMSRLCQGDVGSGKTMVAAALCYFAAKNGLQTAFMAPTEVLAEQHYKGLAPLMQRLGLRTALITGSTGAKARRELLAKLAAGEIDLLLGTHALISEDVAYQKLGLVITDEQHRFGVRQRAVLSEKGIHPHMLVMSATPIPRTLALILYGDLDVSLIDELPPGRQKIDTFFLPTSYHERIYNFLRKQVAEGRQAYVVCPMVEENEEIPDERKSVMEYAQFLQEKIFPDLKIGYVHGRMKPKEKAAAMAAFAANETHILVSTTVIEVGVDVPNATVMLVENAERFGLSQLHQLRGRVGRGKHKSYCILLSDNRNPETKERLKVMTETADGFRIAEEDLRLRGPGDFFGQRQHGLPAMRAADLSCDMPLLQEAQTAAEELLRQDPGLVQHPLMREKVTRMFAANTETLN